MKKILGFIALSFIILSFGFTINTAYANTGSGITVVTTAEIPGAKCIEQTGDKKGTWECTVQKGFGQITLMLGNMIKYFTFIAGLGGVLFIVINGILYSMGGIDSGGKDEAKKRIVKTLTGLAILLLSGVILNAIAPWIYTF